MALFNKNELLASSVQRRTFASPHEKVLEAVNAKEQIKKVGQAFYSWNEYEIFLSHSYEDKVLINNLRETLVKFGYKVYVDWIEDCDLDRQNVTQDTVDRLRARMKTCKCLFYATSLNSVNSKWMPWELGYFDGLKSRVAILPIVETSESSFAGQEYLNVYPYVDKAGTALFINKGGRYVNFTDWLNGKIP